MGCEIHLVIDQKDTEGQWHTLWHSALYYTPWFYEHHLKPIGKNTYDNPYNLYDIDFRGYGYFNILSAALDDNPLWKHEIGTQKTGLMTPGWPETATYASQDLTDPRHYQSHGWMTLRDLKTMRERVCRLDLQTSPKNSDLEEDLEMLCDWFNKVEKAVNGLTNGSLGQIIGRAPNDHDFGDPNYPVYDAGSAHAAMKIINGRGWDTLCPGDDNVRILVCYDK